ncbi:MAG TPA: phosphatase PAP2 family protein [Gemmatimonadales bacterium]|nr:phosphatase PAP2 family protein [Gemmatimonadales bacterium]
MAHSLAGVHRLTALCSTLAFGAGGLAAQNATPRYTAGWGDVAAVAGAGLLTVAGALAHPPAAACAPCNSADLIGFDRGVIDWNSTAARRGSDILLLSVVGGAALASVGGMEPARARGDAAVLANALLWTTAATEWIKVGVHRARPALYRSGAVEAAAVHENRESFPSGHASVAFAAATTYATLAARQHLPHATRNSILLYAGAVSVSVLRVAGGKHFPTDVIGGAALGTGIGWAVARLHPMTR